MVCPMARKKSGKSRSGAKKKLRASRSNRVFLGVFGGLAEYFENAPARALAMGKGRRIADHDVEAPLARQEALEHLACLARDLLHASRVEAREFVIASRARVRKYRT